MNITIPVGLHFSPGLLQASYVQDGRMKNTPEYEIGKDGTEYFWFRPAPDQLEYFSIHDLVGVEIEKGSPEQAISGYINRVLDGLELGDHVTVNPVMAVPMGLHDFQRRRLISIVSTPARRLGLIDSSMAALLASQEAVSPAAATVAVVVAEDRALEIAIACVAKGQCRVLAQEQIEELSGRALNHHLLSTLIGRLPDRAQAALAAHDDAALSAILSRLAKSRSLLGRVVSVGFPIPVSGAGDSSVKLNQADMNAFFSERAVILKSALAKLREKAGSEARHIERVVSVGDFNEFAEWTARLEEELAPVEVAPMSLVTDGAAMAARDPSRDSTVVETPEPIPLDRLVRGRATPIRIATPAMGPADDLAGVVDRLFTHVAQLIARGNAAEARVVLNGVRQRATGVLAALAEAPASAPSRPLSADVTEVGLPDVRQPRPQTDKAKRAKRALDQAERMLQAERPLEAVNLSHQALALAGEDHDVLMALLDIHRRSALLLSGPANFAAAVTQLRCALEHRQNDTPTRIALADRYVEQALYVEQQGQAEEAGNLLEQALLLADDDSAILEHLRRLGGG